MTLALRCNRAGSGTVRPTTGTTGAGAGPGHRSRRSRDRGGHRLSPSLRDTAGAKPVAPTSRPPPRKDATSLLAGRGEPKVTPQPPQGKTPRHPRPPPPGCSHCRCSRKGDVPRFDAGRQGLTNAPQYFVGDQPKFHHEQLPTSAWCPTKRDVGVRVVSFTFADNKAVCGPTWTHCAPSNEMLVKTFPRW